MVISTGRSVFLRQFLFPGVFYLRNISLYIYDKVTFVASTLGLKVWHKDLETQKRKTSVLATNACSRRHISYKYIYIYICYSWNGSANRNIYLFNVTDACPRRHILQIYLYLCIYINPLLSGISGYYWDFTGRRCNRGPPSKLVLLRDYKNFCYFFSMQKLRFFLNRYISELQTWCPNFGQGVRTLDRVSELRARGSGWRRYVDRSLWFTFTCWINISTVWCNQMGTVFVEMSTWTALTRYLGMKTTF